MLSKPMTRAILFGGLTAGALDITYAIVVNGFRDIPARTILQSVASGIHGRPSYSGGWSTALQGLGLHFFMTLLMATAFCLLVQKVQLVRDKVMMAVLPYGLFLFALMNFVVVPLSNAFPGKVPSGWHLLGALFAHTVLVALPIAIAARTQLVDTAEDSAVAAA